MSQSLQVHSSIVFFGRTPKLVMSRFALIRALPFVPAFAPISISTTTHVLPPPTLTTQRKKRSHKDTIQTNPLPTSQHEFKQITLEHSDQKTKKQVEAERGYKKKKLKLSSEFLKRNMKGDLVNMYNFYPESKDDSKLLKPDSAEKLHLHIPFQMVVTGKTGSGKTNYMENLSYALGCFDKIWLVVKDEDEYLYKKWIDELRKEEKDTGQSILTVLNRPEEFEDITTLN